MADGNDAVLDRDGYSPLSNLAAKAGWLYLPSSSLFNSMGLTGLSGQIAASAVAGGITGGGKGVLAGAVSAGMFSQLHGMDPGFGKVLAHGAVGGMMSEMQGGSFKSGFLAAGFTQALSPAIGRIDSGTVGPSVQRTIVAAIVGGTASVIGGGKFANGAMTGAFSRLFNDDRCFRAGTCGGKFMNTKASCGPNCVPFDSGAGGKLWVSPGALSELASVKAGNLNNMGDLTTTNSEASKILGTAALAVGGGELLALRYIPAAAETLGSTATFLGAGSFAADPTPQGAFSAALGLRNDLLIKFLGAPAQLKYESFSVDAAIQLFENTGGK